VGEQLLQEDNVLLCLASEDSVFTIAWCDHATPDSRRTGIDQTYHSLKLAKRYYSSTDWSSGPYQELLAALPVKLPTMASTRAAAHPARW